MKSKDYTFTIGDLATIHEGMTKKLHVDLTPKQPMHHKPKAILEAKGTDGKDQPILIEADDFILMPTVMMTVMVAPKRMIGKPFQLPGFLIKWPASIVKGFGVKYIRYKLAVELHRRMLETHRFAFHTVISLEQIAKMKLSLVIEEANTVNAEASQYMKQIGEATAKAIFAHQRAIEQWRTDIKVLLPTGQHWH